MLCTFEKKFTKCSYKEFVCGNTLSVVFRNSKSLEMKSIIEILKLINYTCAIAAALQQVPAMEINLRAQIKRACHMGCAPTSFAEMVADPSLSAACSVKE